MSFKAMHKPFTVICALALCLPAGTARGDGSTGTRPRSGCVPAAAATSLCIGAQSMTRNSD